VGDLIRVRGWGGGGGGGGFWGGLGGGGGGGGGVSSSRASRSLRRNASRRSPRWPRCSCTMSRARRLIPMVAFDDRRRQRLSAAVSSSTSSSEPTRPRPCRAFVRRKLTQDTPHVGNVTDVAKASPTARRSAQNTRCLLAAAPTRCPHLRVSPDNPGNVGRLRDGPRAGDAPAASARSSIPRHRRGQEPSATRRTKISRPRAS